jgi:hypothetical protein
MMQQRKDSGAITRGAIFVEESPFLPLSVLLERGPTRCGWARAASAMEGGQLERTLTAAGWTSYYVAGGIKTTVFGFHWDKMLAAAWKRLITNLQKDGANCVEIDDVAESSYCGVPYVTLSAHARQVHGEKLLRSH